MSIHKNASVADSVIRNTFYLIMQQASTFLFPLLLTPLIVSFIGTEQFGIYALVLGFITMFGLFDLSISSSFVVFLSRYIGQNDRENLNSYFSTGLIFYFLFSLLVCAAAYILREPLLSVLNVPAHLKEVTEKVYIAGLAIFFLNSVFSVYSSALISIQKMYITSLAGIYGGIISFALTVALLYLGFGLFGVVISQLAASAVVSVINFSAVKKHLPEIRARISAVRKNAVKEMVSFGSQMQLSKLAGFASEKYDEFLLAHFTSLTNVSFFNIASRISRAGRLLPFQIIPQIAPVAAGLKARGDNARLEILYHTASKYLLLASAPVFVFVFAFSDLIIRTWMGSGFETSALILKVLVTGQLVNLTISAPGNSIIPNTGYPRIQMYEGIINLALNIVLSYVLIMKYGIVGAAIGSVVSTVISSAYVFVKSSVFFRQRLSSVLRSVYMVPVLSAAGAGTVAYLSYNAYTTFFGIPEGRAEGIAVLAVLAMIFSGLFASALAYFKYLSKNDKVLIAKTIKRLVPVSSDKSQAIVSGEYRNELVSVFVVTHCRLSMLKKCITSLIRSLKDVNYELIIADNASTDGTGEFLTETEMNNPRVRVISNSENIGVNAKSQAAKEYKGQYIVGIDDDVIDFPDNWVQEMVKAYKTIPAMGYLATDVVQDETTTGAKHEESAYFREEFADGIRLLTGPVGGWCFMISREVYNDIGPLITFPDRIFFVEDDDYVNRAINKGYRYGILEGVCVYHAAGEFHNREFKEVFDTKYADYKRGFPLAYRIRRKVLNALSLKRLLNRISLLSKENFSW